MQLPSPNINQRQGLQVVGATLDDHLQPIAAFQYQLFWEPKCSKVFLDSFARQISPNTRQAQILEVLASANVDPTLPRDLRRITITERMLKKLEVLGNNINILYLTTVL